MGNATFNSVLGTGLFLLLIVAAAQVSVSLPSSVSGIPFTAQSLVVFISACYLRPWSFAVCIVLYMGMGIAGLPVFAGGASGIDVITGNTGGFLYGFLFSGLFISTSGVKDKAPQFLALLNLMIQATLVLFFFGLVHLSFKTSITSAVEYGFLPFWKMALVKAILAATIVYLVNLQLKKH